MAFRKLDDNPKARIPQCRSLGHNPPGHEILFPGTYEWKCDLCGATQIVHVPDLPRL